MKKQTSLSIPKACSEAWNNFTPTSNGGFCSSCNKEVINFTTMTDDEILDFFNNRPFRMCGRFRPDQLKNYSYHPLRNFNSRWRLLKAGFLSFLLILTSKSTFAQRIIVDSHFEIVNRPDPLTVRNITVDPEHWVKGIVRSEEDNEPIPGVNVLLKGSEIGTTTDSNGWFEFPKKLKHGDVLIFSFIGFVTKEYVVPKESSEVIEIPLTLYYDIMGEVAVNDLYTTNKSGFARFWQKIKTIF